jgi:hypothetical protein
MIPDHGRGARVKIFLLLALISFKVVANETSDYQPSKEELRRCDGKKVAPCTIYPLPLLKLFPNEYRISTECSMGKSLSCRRLADFYTQMQPRISFSLKHEIMVYLSLACYHGDFDSCIEGSKRYDIDGNHWDATNLGMLACERTKAKSVCDFFQFRLENPEKVKDLLRKGFDPDKKKVKD